MSESIRSVSHTCALVLGAFALGCGSGDRDGDPFGEGGGSGLSETSGADDGGGPGGDADADADGDGDAGDDDGIKLDVAAGDTEGSTAEGGSCDPNVDADCGCTAVDLLFVIDNSVSMNNYQVALGQAFPTFADEIIDVLPPGTNLHVGVTSTEMKYSSSGSTSNCFSTGDNGQPQSAFYLTPDVQNTGTNGAQGRLYTANGKPFFEIDTDAPAAEVQELKDWFSVAAHIGDNGSQVEMSAAGAGWAADPANDATNAGFIRDEGAVLVLFFIQDEADQTPATASQEIIDKIASAKQGCGGMDCVIGGGFVNEWCLPMVPLGNLLDALSEPPVIATLPNKNDVTPETFIPVLRDTLAGVIGEKCEEIPPPEG